MAVDQITDFGYEVFLTPRSSTGQNKECLFTGIVAHSPIEDVTEQVQQYCQQQGLVMSEYSIHKDLTIY
jgi:hypothetical protein